MLAQRSVNPRCCSSGTVKRRGLLVTIPQGMCASSNADNTESRPSNSEEAEARFARYRSNNSSSLLLKPGLPSVRPNARVINARAPFDTWDLMLESSSGGSECCPRSKLMTTTKSGAVSISVPSRSKSTASILLIMNSLVGLKLCVHEVVYRRVVTYFCCVGDRVVSHATNVLNMQGGISSPST